jgi:hypothetical protein
MERAGPAVVIALLAMAGAACGATPARADCGEEIKSVRVQMPAVKEPPRRDELQKLVEKAEKDEKAGRVQLCYHAMKHASALLK